MSPEEFENYCQGLVDVDSSSNNVLNLLQTNLKVLTELKDKQRLLKQETLKLQTDITIFRQLMQNKYTACLNNNKENYTQNVPGYVRNSNQATSSSSLTSVAVASTSFTNDLVNISESAQDVGLLEPMQPQKTSVEEAVTTTSSQ